MSDLIAQVDPLNELLSELADKSDEYPVKGLENTGKCIPYIGWGWRSLDPKYISIADCGKWIGFCANNKWYYPENTLTGNDATKVWGLLMGVVQAPSLTKLQTLFDTLQTYRTLIYPHADGCKHDAIYLAIEYDGIIRCNNCGKRMRYSLEVE